MNLTVRQAWTEIFGPNVDPWWVVEVLAARRIARRLEILEAYLAAATIARKFTQAQLAKLCACSRERLNGAMTKRRRAAAPAARMRQLMLLNE